MMLAHHGALDKLQLFHLEDGGFNHQRDYKRVRYVGIAKNQFAEFMNAICFNLRRLTVIKTPSLTT